MRLDELALKYDTDKSSKAHGYTRHYERVLGSWRNRPFKMLEIGIAYGASIRTWREYFPQAEIACLDIDPDACERVADLDVSYYCGSQADVPFLREVEEKAGPFDLVIDDGSHYGPHIEISFAELFPLLTPGGIYVIEDLHTSYGPWGGNGGLDLVMRLMGDVMLNGKTGWGDPTCDPQYPEFRNSLSLMERWIGGLILHKNIAFIYKRTQAL